MNLDLYKTGQLKQLKSLQSRLSQKKNIQSRLALLEKGGQKAPYPLKERYYFALLQAIGQAHLLPLFEKKSVRKEWVCQLEKVERFFNFVSGCVGYQHFILELLTKDEEDSAFELHYPQVIDLQKQTTFVNKMLYSGLKNLPKCAEVYVVGGAGDRLNLQDPKTKKPLPVAFLRFLDKTLLENLIQNIEAREYLYWKLFAKRITTPILLMTSDEKDNNAHILNYLKTNHYFGRKKNSFHFLHQPSVPLVDKEGRWEVKKAKLQLKPGGHGMLWKLMEEQGGFSFLAKHKRSFFLIRQINNPVGGVDLAHLPFMGIGIEEKKAFGFATCERLVNAPEGMIVVKKEKKTSYLTNVEYTEFTKLGLKDVAKEHSNSSYFPANSNILFVNCKKIIQAIKKNPLPGLILNFKDQKSGRLESTMQNIADALTSSNLLKNYEKLHAFATFNKREKTLSVCKQKIQKRAIEHTLLGALFDYFRAQEELLEMCSYSFCKQDKKTFLKHPSFIFEYRPILGPLFSIISQKIKKGRLGPQSELYLNITNLEMCNVDIEGSLCIEAFDLEQGSCILHNVKIKNKGLQFKSKDWQGGRYHRKGTLEIILHKQSAFFAQNVTFLKSQKIIVKAGMVCTAVQVGSRVQLVHEPIKGRGFKWHYTLNKNKEIIIKKSPLI
jgi:UDP-N-acetylglucosamine pyrophosphorylase